MRRAAVGFMPLLVGLSLLPAVAHASEAQPVQLAGETTLVGADARRHVVQVDEPVSIDLGLVADHTGEVLPAALSVTGGQGFRGFLLTEPGRLDGLVALAVALPEPDEAADGSAVHGTGWGQASTGGSCLRCTVPPGTYELYLLTGGMFDDSPSQVEVSVQIDGLSGEARLEASAGEPVVVIQNSGNEMTSADDAHLGGGGFAWTWAWKIGGSWTGLMVDQMAVSYTGRMAPPVLTHTEFCRDIGDNRDCDEDTRALSEHQTSQVKVTPFDVPPETAVGAGVSWDVVGNADYRAIKNVLFVDIGPVTTIEADGPDEEPQSQRLLQLW